MNDKLTLRIKNDLSELEGVAQAFSDFNKKYQLPVKVSNAIDLALDEILTNIISYGYEDRENHFIDVRISLKDEKILLEVEDDGREFNPLAIPEADTASAVNERPIGGLGLHLIRNMMDEIRYTYKNNKNCLSMKKTIKDN